MINVWEELVLDPQIWPGSNRSLQQVTWHKNHVMVYKMSSWHSLSRCKMTIECKRSFVEMTYDKPNYASFGPFYLVDCLNYTAQENINATSIAYNLHIYTKGFAHLPAFPFLQFQHTTSNTTKLASSNTFIIDNVWRVSDLYFYHLPSVR